MTKAERQLAELDEQRAELDAQRAKLIERIQKQRSRKMIQCTCCKKLYRICDLEFVQTYHYIDPFGCNGGDYWTPSEGGFLCPDSNVRNRFLFSSYWDAPYEKRNNFEYNAGQQFMKTYGPLFKSHSEDHERYDPKRKSIPNFYVDENHKKFGIELVGVGT